MGTIGFTSSQMYDVASSTLRLGDAGNRELSTSTRKAKTMEEDARAD